MTRLVERLRSGASGALRNKLFRATGVLVSGSALGSLITACAMPLLTRLYTPGEMGALAVFSSIVTIFSVAICLRFDVALSVPAEEEEAVNLLAIGALSIVVLSVPLGLTFLLIPVELYRRAGLDSFAPYAWMVTPAVVLLGFYSLLQYWSVRLKDFKSVAASRVAQSGGSAAFQIGLGAAGLGVIGLLGGYAMNGGVGALFLAWRRLRANSAMLSQVSAARMRELWRSYGNYPRYSAADALVNAIGVQLPVVLIASIADSHEAGLLMLALFVMQAPIALLGNAIGQVFIAEAPERFRAGTLGSFTTTVIGNLLRTGVGPIFFAGIVAPTTFGVIFGEEWTRAGVLVAWMTPWFAVHLITVPVAMSLQVTGHQRAALHLQLIGLVIRTGAVLAAWAYAVQMVSEAYAVSGLILYSIYLGSILYYAGASLADLARELRRSLAILIAWCVLGGVTAGAAAWLLP